MRIARHRALPFSLLCGLALVAGCSGPGAASPTADPSASGEASGSPSAEPSPTQRPLASLEPDEEWHPVLELISGPGGRDSGPFTVGQRYRIRYDCVGDGSIVIRVEGDVKARRDCTLLDVAQPEIVRGQDGGRRSGRVSAEGDVEWVVRFEVPG